MESTKLRIAPTPELTVVSGRAVAVRGWRQVDAIEHLNWHLDQPSEKWCPVECMAHTMFQRNSPGNRQRVRKRAARLLRFLLEKKNALLCIEYGATKEDHGRIKAMKIFEPGDISAQRQYALHQIEVMRRRGHLAQELVERAIAIIGVIK